ncbi:MAG: PqqD family protein [Nitrospira sp.]|jgi:hypothetical protein|nr:PqqD family protein [Nitrospira sp.]
MMDVDAPSCVEPQVDLAQLFPVRHEDVHGTVLDGECVLLNLSTGRYYTLNVVGAFVWEHCTGTRSLAHILSCIPEHFDVTPKRAQSDGLDLVFQLRQEGLIRTERR